MKSFSVFLVIFWGREVYFRKTSDPLEASGQFEALAHIQTWILSTAFLLLATGV